MPAVPTQIATAAVTRTAHRPVRNTIRPDLARCRPETQRDDPLEPEVPPINTLYLAVQSGALADYRLSQVHSRLLRTA